MTRFWFSERQANIEANYIDPETGESDPPIYVKDSDGVIHRFTEQSSNPAYVPHPVNKSVLVAEGENLEYGRFLKGRMYQ